MIQYNLNTEKICIFQNLVFKIQFLILLITLSANSNFHSKISTEQLLSVYLQILAFELFNLIYVCGIIYKITRVFGLIITLKALKFRIVKMIIHFEFYINKHVLKNCIKLQRKLVILHYDENN